MGRIENINSKFNWARQHFQILNAEIAEYLKINPCKFVSKGKVSEDENGRRWISGTFEAIEPIPEALPLIIGDCLQNLRSTLDFLVWELVGANGKVPTIRNAFPVAHTVDSYEKEIKGNRLKDVDPAAIDIIQSLQPYHLPVPEESILSVLNNLANIQKHRRLLLTCLRTIRPVPNMQMLGDQTFAIVDPPTTQGNAEFGPFEVFGNQVKVEANLIAYVAFDEAPVQGFGVHGLIEATARFVDAKVLALFERFL
jgi:hypothetical protein